MKISCKTFDFAVGHYPANTMDVSWFDLVWAALTVGKAPKDSIFPHGLHSAFDAVARIANLHATLNPSENNIFFYKTKHYEEMEKSEKGYVSYSHGMMLAKLAATKLFGIPWLQHLESFENDKFNCVTYRPVKSKSRPDLIGIRIDGGTEKYSVFEAKGRSNYLCKITLKKANEQARMIAQINGCDPEYRIATESYYSGKYLQLALQDPDDFEIEAYALKINPQLYFASYYSPIELLCDEMSFDLRRLGVGISIDQEVRNLLINGRFEELLHLLEKRNSDQEETSDYKIFSDGVIVKLDPQVWGTNISDF